MLVSLSVDVVDCARNRDKLAMRHTRQGHGQVGEGRGPCRVSDVRTTEMGNDGIFGEAKCAKDEERDQANRPAGGGAG